MICTMVNQLTKNATLKELEEAGLSSCYADHNKGIYPVDASGVVFTANYFVVIADPIADLTEECLRQREVVHFNRFKELYE